MMKHMAILAFLVISMTGMAQQIPDYVPTDGLVAYYPFDVNLNDASGAGNDGSGEVAGFDEGKTGQAAVFTGSQIVDLPMSISYPERTVALWARVDADGWQLIFSDDHGGLQNGFSLVGYGHPDLTNSVGVQFGTSSSGRLEVALNSWVHVAAVRRVDSTFHYFNGVLQSAEESGFYHSVAGVPNARVGADRGGGRKFTGAVDELLIYDQCLSEDEILGLYLGETPMMGCTNSAACNFDPDANVDDGSCAELDACGECGGVGVLGCTDVNSCNYNPEATCDNGGCVIDNGFELPEEILTCQDEIELAVPSSYPNILWSHGENTPVVSVSESGTYSVQTSVEGTTNHIYSGSQTIDISGSSTVTSNESFSVSLDLKFDSVPAPAVSGGDPNYNVIDQGPGGQWGIVWFEQGQVLRFDVKSGVWHSVDFPIVLGEWVHLLCVYSVEEQTMEIWADGVLIDSQSAPSSLFSWSGAPGLKVNRNANWNFSLDNLHVLSGAQDGATFDAKCSSAVGPSSLLYYDFDVVEDGVLSDLSGNGLNASTGEDFPVEIYPGACPTLGECVFTASVDVQFLDCNALDGIQGMCGPGTSWDPNSGACVITNPSDTDFDGCVSMTDLLDLLTVFGTCAEEEPEENPEVVEWSCGDPLEYQGYDYETVQIGEQCWFAENARYLPSVFPEADRNPTDARAYVWNYNGQDVNEAAGLETFVQHGAIYNLPALHQWQLCPANWHVSSDLDWFEIEAYYGMVEEDLTDYGFDRGANQGVGTSLQSAPLNVAPNAGWMHQDLGFLANGETRYWTLDSSLPDEMLHRRLSASQSGIYRNIDWASQAACSVRCIQDSE